MGKTILLDGLAATTGGRYTRVLELSGRLARSGLPLQPWRDILVNLAASQEGSGDYALLMALASPETSSSAEAEGTEADSWLRTTVDAMVRSLSSGPTLLLIDDAHLLDSASEQMAWELFRRHPDLSMVVSALPAHRWAEIPWADVPMAVVNLGPLATGAAEGLLKRHLVSRMPPEHVCTHILSLASGHPLFLEELADAWMERGSEITGGSGVALPATIQAALVRRLDPLPIAEQTLLKILCLVGPEAEPGLISALHPAFGTPEAVLAGIEHLSEVHLLELGDYAAGGAGPSAAACFATPCRISCSSHNSGASIARLPTGWKRPMVAAQRWPAHGWRDITSRQDSPGRLCNTWTTPPYGRWRTLHRARPSLGADEPSLSRQNSACSRTRT